MLRKDIYRLRRYCSMDVSKLTITKAHEHLTAGDISAVELAESFLKTIDQKNAELNVFLEVYDDVLEQAKRADTIIAEKKANALTGIPLAVKTIFCLRARWRCRLPRFLRATRLCTIRR
jgi:Asp-tRNAAsn/Glu-tRNAGln amidotransferase A subunit and related amidases